MAAYSQYERMLHDYSEYLETGNIKLKTECIIVSNLDDLRKQVAHHRVSSDCQFPWDYRAAVLVY